MLKYLLCLLFAFPVFGVEKIRINPLITDEEGGRYLQEIFDSGEDRIEVTSAFKSMYSNGDFVILLGIGAKNSDQDMTADEYKRLWGVMNYVTRSGFRVVMNVRSTIGALQNAVLSGTSSVILLSGHGNEKGLYDFNGEKIPYSIFENASPSLYQLIVSACYGRLAIDDYYNIPKTIRSVYAWKGLTNSNDLMSFLLSESWDIFDGKFPKQ